MMASASRSRRHPMMAGTVILAALTVLIAACGPKESPVVAPTPSNSASARPGPSSVPNTGPSAAPSATPSSRPTTSRPPTRPPGTAKPTAANTGVPPGIRLEVVNGDRTFAKDGEIITGKDFHGFVFATGKNITFRNCVFRGGDARGRNYGLLDTTKGNNTVIEDSEFVPSVPSATIDGIWASRTSIVRVNVHGAVDGIKTSGTDVTIQDSFIHDTSWFAHDPNQGGGPTHNDGVQSFEGATRVTLRHNTIDMSTTTRPNAAWQTSARDSVVDGNWLDGGGCTLNFAHAGLPSLTGNKVINNRFGRHSVFNCPILLSTRASLAQNTGNVFDDNNAAIPAPQVHD
jgi:hypothetical protein